MHRIHYGSKHTSKIDLEKSKTLHINTDGGVYPRFTKKQQVKYKNKCVIRSNLWNFNFPLIMSTIHSQKISFRLFPFITQLHKYHSNILLKIHFWMLPIKQNSYFPLCYSKYLIWKICFVVILEIKITFNRQSKGLSLFSQEKTVIYFKTINAVPTYSLIVLPKYNVKKKEIVFVNKGA